MIFGNAEVTVIKSKRKTISIQIKPDEVIVRAPTRMKQSEIEKLVESKRNWIEKHLKSVYEKQNRKQNRRYHTVECEGHFHPTNFRKAQYNAV